MFRAWWYPFSHYGVIHGDPHLGNYTIFDDAKGRPAGINLLDYGCIRIFPPSFVGGVVDLAGDTVELHEGFRICERGAVVDDLEPEHFFRCLIYLLKNEKLRERLKRDGTAFAFSKYSVDRLADDIASLYAEIDAERHGTPGPV